MRKGIVSGFVRMLALSAALYCGFSVAEEHTANAQGLSTFTHTWDFENAPNHGWWFGGNAGDGTHTGAPTGPHDIWINNWNSTVWNSANVQFSVAGYGASRGYCDVSWWQRTGANLSGATLHAYENSNGTLTNLGGYSIDANGGTYSFRSTRFYVDSAVNHGHPVLLTFGFWGVNNGSEWMGIDDVHAECYVYN